LSVYFDACVLVPIFVAEDSSERVNSFLDGLAARIQISDLGVAEVGAAVSRRVRMGDDSEAVGLETLAAFDEWVMAATVRHAIEPDDVRRAGALVRRFDLKLLTPDAIHLAVCERLGFQLATLDRRLAAAAEMIGVSCFVP
jgi:uncharacterized protein